LTDGLKTQGREKLTRRDTKMPLRRKAFLALPILLITFSLLTFIYLKSKEVSSASLNGSNNRFHLIFNIVKKDEDKLNLFLEKVKVEPKIKEGIFFELDATSSAALAFSLPLKAELEITQSQISLEGKYNGPLLKQYAFEKIKIPKSTNLAIFGPNLGHYLLRHYFVPQDLSLFLTEQTSNIPNYLVFFGEESNVALLFKQEKTFFESLNSIKSLEGEIYKKEEFDPDLQLHLLKLKDRQSLQEATITIFKIEDYIFITSSRNTAESLIRIYKNQDESDLFNIKNNAISVSFTFYYRNTNNADISNLYRKVFFQQPAFISGIQNIKYLEFLLKQNSFSGLIELK